MRSAEHVVFHQPPDLPGIEILSVENSLRLWKVFHTTYTICTGFAWQPVDWIYRHTYHTTPQRRLMVLEPGETHNSYRVRGPGTFKVVLITPALVATLAAEANIGPAVHFRTAEVADSDLFRAFARMHGAIDDSAATQLERESRLVNALGRLIARYAERTPSTLPTPRHCLRCARDYLEAHVTESLSLATLAGVAGLSRFHFLRAFTQTYGIPPHAFQIARRIDRVRQMLRCGIPTAAIDVGFADQSHLVRHFRRIWGVTPARYAAMIGAR